MKYAPLLALLALLGACHEEAPRDLPPVDGSVLVDAEGPVADAPPRVNGCARELAVDRSATGADRSVTVEDDFYTPRCMRIARGQQVTWTGDFEDHPLEPGIIRPPDVESQPGSPIESTGSGVTATFTFPDEGAWAYYCPAHPPDMAGVIYVE